MWKYIRTILLSFSVLFSVAPKALADSVTDLPVKTVNGRQYYYYDIKPKDTEYSLCRKYGITREDILKYNPSQRDGLKAYATLYFPVDVFSLDPLNRIENVETLSDVSQETTLQKENVDIEDELQPTIDAEPVHGHVFIGDETPQDESGTLQSHLPNSQFADILQNTDSIEADETEVFTITVMLPLESKASNPSKLALLYGEFYRGFLIGVEEMSHSGAPVHINVVDTSLSDEEYFNLLDSELISSSDLFIGPETESKLKSLSVKANETEAPIINAFVINDDLYSTNASIVQTNIPREKMYEGAIDEFLKLYPNTVPVFIARVDGEADKVSFTDQLKDALTQNKRPFKEIVYHGVLTLEDLQGLRRNENYVFVPVSASRSEFSKYVSGLRDLRNEISSMNGSVTLFGFPEWTTFRGDQLEHLKELEATIYSRFVNDTNFQTSLFKDNFMKWYGTESSDVEPNQALLGYDIARFTINNLRKGEGDFFPSGTAFNKGLQSSFALSKPNENGGYVNSALYIINFKTLGAPEVRIIQVAM